MANALALLFADTLLPSDQGLVAIRHPFRDVRYSTQKDTLDGVIELRLEMLLRKFAKLMEVPKRG